MKLRFLLFIVAGLLLPNVSKAQIGIPSATPVTQNFDGIGNTATAALPANWKSSPAGTAAPTWAAGGNLTATTQQASGASPTAGGFYNWGDGTTTTDRSIGYMTSGGYASPNSIMAWYQNTSGVQINDLTISFDYERYRINTAACAITFFTSTDGTTWTAQTAGDSGAFSTGTSSYTFTGGTNVPKSFTLSGVNIANGGNFYLRWNFNTTGTNSQGVGLDNVSVTATLGAPVFTTNQAGNWATGSTWIGGTAPGPADNVIVNHAVVATAAVTRNAGTTTTVNTAGTINMQGATYTNNGTTTVNGTFRIESGGWATGNNLVYSGTSSNLTFDTNANYGVNNTDVYWPTANGPYNVTVANSYATLGVTLNGGMTRTIAGNLTLGGGMTMSTGALTINGTCQILAGGFFSAAPIFGASSTLNYQTLAVYGRGFEWSALGVGTIGVTPGYPNNVTVGPLTTLNYNNGTPLAKAMAGNLFVSLNAVFDMSYGGGASGGTLTVAGNVNLAGSGSTLILGNTAGDDLRLAGDFTNGGTFNGNNRAIWFTKASGTQAVNSNSIALTIPYVVFDSSGNRTVSFGTNTNVTISAPLAGNAISYGSASDIIAINSNTLTIGTAAVANTITGAGTISGTTASNLTLRGTGSIGTLSFTTGSQNLGTFTMNRTASTVGCTMGTALTVGTSLALTNGHVDLANNIMTIGGAATITGASATNYIIADAGYGTSASLRKTFTAAGSFVYPVGDRAASADGSQYSPVTLNFAGGSYGGYAGVVINDIKHPSFDAASEYITRYWDVTTSGITSPTTFTANGTYLDIDVNTPVQEANYIGNKWNGSVWSNGGGNVTPATNVTNTVPCTAGATNHVTAGRRDSDINVRHVPSATNYLTGSTYDFGTVAIGFTNAVAFTIQNIGQQSLTLTPTTSAAPYTYTTPYTSPVTGPSGTTTFVITFTPTGTGTFTGSITIPSNDPDEASYVINFTGVGVNPSPEINVKGFTGGTNGITSGQPVGAVNPLNNTQFASINIGSSQTKDYEIQNVTGSTAVLNLTGVPRVAISGTNASDFAVTSAQPSSPIAIGSSSTFIITFTPSGVGTRTALITIANNDNDENPYTYYVQGTGVCTVGTNTVTPTSGPPGTEVTITAVSGNLTGATATFNGVSAVVTPVDATHVKVIIPAGATTGDLVTTNAAGCTASVAYTVIRKLGQPCEGGSVPSDLFISQFTDSNFGALTYVEIYNGTGTTINLANYSLKTANNGGAYTFTLALGAVNLASGNTYVVALGDDDQCGTPGGDGSLAALVNGGGSVNFTANQHDHVALFNGATHVDSWGIFGNNNWAPGFIGTNGASFSRLNTVTVPNTTYSNADWTITDYAGSACANNDYTDIGSYVPSTAQTPTVTLNPTYTPSCKATSFTVSGTEGFAGGNALAYQWYAVAPNTAAWTPLSNTGVYSGVTTATLSISSLAGLDGYQFYCQIRENGVTCYSATNAVKVIEANTVTWNGSAWSPAPPTIGSIAVINGNYNTSTNGDIDACSLIVNSPATLTITPSDYVNIQNDLTVNTGASLIVQNSGSLVMIDDNGVVTNNGTTQVIRTTSPYNKYDYTYWSSPVTGATIGATFPTWRTDYAFQFVTANYADVIAPFDGFDDNQNAWVYTPTSTVMAKGKGYAIMAPTTGTFPTTNTVTFSGPANNGVVNILLAASANGASNTDDFNLVGNPYPSAISANDFINLNTNISGTLYFWTHRTGISPSNPGPDANNFITADYAMYNLSGGTSSGTGSPVPNGYVSTGEGFFVEANAYTNIVFNNSMRSKTHDNSQFFRLANHNTHGAHLSETAIEKDRIWLNLESADGLFSQQLIAYFDNTTLDFDRGYDGIVSQSSNTLSFYSFIAEDKYRIQARPAFDETDVVPLGFSSTMAGTYTIGIGTKEGQLNSSETNIYLEDKQLGIIHDLKQAPYTFTTPAGVFNERFVLRYMNSALGNDDFDHLQNSVAVAVSNSQIAVKSYSEPISHIIVYDILGRQVFEKKNVGENQFTVNGVVANQQALIVKIKLENGAVVNKKIIF